jgi:hypothetical protein
MCSSRHGIPRLHYKRPAKFWVRVQMNIEWEAAYGVIFHDANSEDGIVPETQPMMKKQSQKNTKLSRGTSCDQTTVYVSSPTSCKHHGIPTKWGPQKSRPAVSSGQSGGRWEDEQDTDSETNLKCRTPTTATGLLNWQYPRPHAARHKIIFGLKRPATHVAA